MAKVTSPLFSLEAHGDLGGALRYQKRKGTNYVKKLNNLPSSVSAGQRAWRQHYIDTWNAWWKLSIWQKLNYTIIAYLRGWQSGQHAHLFLNL